MNELTRLLGEAGDGDPAASDRLLRIVYDELRGMAAGRIRREPAGHSLDATALVHEAWLRLGGDAQPHWRNRAHFFSAASEAMRRILIDQARRRMAARHGGGRIRVELPEIPVVDPARDEELLAVHEALDALAALHPEKAELVKLRYFAGFSFEETATALGIAVPTAKKWWAFARAWLFAEIRNDRGDPPPA